MWRSLIRSITTINITAEDTPGHPENEISNPQAVGCNLYIFNYIDPLTAEVFSLKGGRF